MDIKKIRNIMRKDPGVDGDAQRIGQMTWMFFLKVYDLQEETWELNAKQEGKTFVSIIPERLRWRNWALDNVDGKALTGKPLLDLVNNELFPALKNLQISRNTPRSQGLVREVFSDINQYMKDGVLLRQVINEINENDFGDADDRHEFGDIYEKILKDLQGAGSAGEFYTPRALTDFIVSILNPRLGEIFADFASGTGGFLTSALNHFRAQVKTAKDFSLYQKSVIGQEWKPFPYLLSITNLMLHEIEAPNILHCDSLARDYSTFKDQDCADVIAMNPPFGGTTGTGAKNNFPPELRSSETADLFVALITYRLKKGGRVGVILPDGFLFGEDSAKTAIKTRLLKKFNLHTIIRLPGSIFSPYAPLATNILFFNNECAEGAQKGFCTDKTWFYRLDMPEGYKHFSKTKPMLLKHCDPIREWWNDREEIILGEGNEKSRCFSASELIANGCNFDLCKFPKEEEEVLQPKELIDKYYEQRSAFIKHTDGILDKIQGMLPH